MPFSNHYFSLSSRLVPLRMSRRRQSSSRRRWVSSKLNARAWGRELLLFVFVSSFRCLSFIWWNVDRSGTFLITLELFLRYLRRNKNEPSLHALQRHRVRSKILFEKWGWETGVPRSRVISSSGTFATFRSKNLNSAQGQIVSTIRSVSRNHVLYRI